MKGGRGEREGGKKEEQEGDKDVYYTTRKEKDST